MPRAKKSKLVHLTKTEAKGDALKKSLVESIHSCLDKYEYVYAFSVENMRNNLIKKVRTQLANSKFFYGKSRVMAIAFGKDSASEYKENSHLISEHLAGGLGVLFTNETPEHIKAFFESFEELDYSRTGSISTKTIVLKRGELVKGYDFYKRYIETSDNDDTADMSLDNDFEDSADLIPDIPQMVDFDNIELENSDGIENQVETFPPNMEPQLRALGLPTHLVKGHVVLYSDYTLCIKGKVLTAQQAQIIKLFGAKLATFKIIPKCYWHKGSLQML
ncbi:hypothetical protein BB561_001103 [Smittium simulii]|uniref:Ribosome assembly factor mrt4 n=1 Tax=Smittium simulii TaxID=133385 RepID=A0A2T9YW32_9FUNG|nr:hypothetical protein BB561_001103 [Smittium simulii]